MDIEDAYFSSRRYHVQLAADEIMELVQKLPPAYRTVFSACSRGACITKLPNYWK
jgi:hypothetical protein